MTTRAILLDDPDSDTGRFLQWVVEKYEGASVIELPSGDYCPHHPFGCDEPDKDRDV